MANFSGKRKEKKRKNKFHVFEWSKSIICMLKTYKDTLSLIMKWLLLWKKGCPKSRVILPHVDGSCFLSL
jgi:hypothetical protein